MQYCVIFVCNLSSPILGPGLSEVNNQQKKQGLSIQHFIINSKFDLIFTHITNLYTWAYIHCSINTPLASNIFHRSMDITQNIPWSIQMASTVYPKKYAHGFVVLCFVVVMQSFTMNSHEVFIHIHQGSFTGTGAIVRLPQCQWSKPDGYGKISQCITTTKHSKAKTVCIFLGIYCICQW